VRPQRAAFHSNTGAQEKRKKDLSRDSARLSQLPDQVDRVLTTRVVGRRAGSKGGQRRSNHADHASFWQDARHGVPNAIAGERPGRFKDGCVRRTMRSALCPKQQIIARMLGSRTALAGWASRLGRASRAPDR
jgi:hypothetical protein